MKIRITFNNGDCFDVPAEIIAKSRTSYYAEKDGFLEDSVEWDEEMELSMNSYELSDWIGNNMDWEDVSEYAVQVKKDHQTYSEMWHSADFDIVK